MSTVAAPEFRPLRRALYKRVSTDEQLASQTIRNQDRALHRRYDAEFADGSAHLAGEFADDGISGAVPLIDRPQGRRLVDACRRGEVDVICVYRVDRLSRDSDILSDIAHLVISLGVRIESLSEHVDLSTSAGIFQFTILGAVSQLERDTIRDRTVAGRDRAISDGYFINGPIPFGYDVVDRRLVLSTRIVEQLGCTEVELVRELFARLAGGESGLSIIRWLRTMGVPSITRYARRYGPPTEKHHEYWQHARLRDIVHNSLYYGIRKFKLNKHGPAMAPKTPAPVDQIVPAIVSKDLAMRAAEAMRKHKANINTDPEKGFVYLLTGLVRCGSCNTPMYGNHHTSGRKRKQVFHYSCGMRTKWKPEQVCPAPVHPNGFLLEQFICDEITNLIGDREQVLEILRRQVEEHHGNIDRQQDRARALRKQIADFERGKASLRTMLARGHITEQEFVEAKREADEEAAQVRAQLDAIETQEALADTVHQQLNSASEMLDLLESEWPAALAENDRASIRRLIHAVCQNVQVNKGGVAIFTLCFTRRESGNLFQSNDYLQITRYGFVLGSRHRASA